MNLRLVMFLFFPGQRTRHEWGTDAIEEGAVPPSSFKTEEEGPSNAAPSVRVVCYCSKSLSAVAFEASKKKNGRARRGGWVGSEGAKVFSAVDGPLEAREPDLWAGRLSFLSAFSHAHAWSARYLVCRRPKLSLLPFLPARRPGWGARGGGGCAAGVRNVCGTERAMCL